MPEEDSVVISFEDGTEIAFRNRRYTDCSSRHFINFQAGPGRIPGVCKRACLHPAAGHEKILGSKNMRKTNKFLAWVGRVACGGPLASCGGGSSGTSADTTDGGEETKRLRNPPDAGKKHSSGDKLLVGAYPEQYGYSYENNYFIVIWKNSLVSNLNFICFPQMRQKHVPRLR